MKIDYFGIIYKDILGHKTVKEIHQDLFNRTINFQKKHRYYSKNLLGMMYKLSRNAKKLDKGVGHYYKPTPLTPTGFEMKSKTNTPDGYAGGLTELALGMYALFNNDNANKLINVELRVKQDDRKQKIREEYIQEQRNKNIYFYVASRHMDCAKDHLPYQGKLYYDDALLKTDLEELKSYVKNRNMLSIQEIMTKPIWFITRPYCRHFFRAVQTGRVLHNNYSIPTRKTGDYALQTEKGARLEYLKDRLAYLKELYSIHPTRKMKDEILKVKMLIDNLNRYLNNN